MVCACSLSAPRTPRWAISMILWATALVAASSILFNLSASQTLSSAVDISLMTSGSKCLVGEKGSDRHNVRSLNRIGGSAGFVSQPPTPEGFVIRFLCR
jgi:hypothetical protein